MRFSIDKYMLALLILISGTTAADQSKNCTKSFFSGLTLPNIDVLSLTTNLSTVLLTSGSGSVDVCQVTVQYTHPGWNDTINTWIWLPNTNWNGRFQGIGGSGWVTGLETSLSAPVSDHYAGGATDGGHSATASTASWVLASLGNLNNNLMQDFAAISLDEMTSLGKMATNIYFGRPPKYSYWNGCSTGGRQGHMMAQRYPTQYDGILAGSPAINWDEFQAGQYWPQLMMTLMVEVADYVPSPCEMNAFTAAAIATCDELDGLKDGIIAMPGECFFDPMTVVGQEVNCTNPTGTIRLTKKGAQLAASIWQGARDQNGNFIWYGLDFDSPFQGIAATECAGTLDNCQRVPFTIASDWLGIVCARNPNFDFENMTVDQFVFLNRRSVDEFQSVIGTRDIDLSQFNMAGGKMISYHGMADQLIFFNGTVDYYSKVLSFDPSVHDFYRFFPLPGVEHCGGGHGWFPNTAFQQLVKWVEKGEAPDLLHGTATATSAGVEITRKANLCPYPRVFTYKAGRNPDKASSFECV